MLFLTLMLFINFKAKSVSKSRLINEQDNRSNISPKCSGGWICYCYKEIGFSEIDTCLFLT